jgi:uncharacterized protein
MSADRKKSVAFDPEIVNQLACPACLGALRLEATHLVCAGCGHKYPIVDGIPVLIVERALGADS